jgi:hypothetical protein
MATTLAVPTRTIFGTFNQATAAGATVQIKKCHLLTAVADSLQLKDTADTKSLAVFNLAQLYGFKYDFHLSFKCDDTGTWANDAHFCARNEEMGKNACFYWFYKLVNSNGALSWSFTGTAPLHDENKDLINPIGILTTSTTGGAGKLAARNARAPLDKILAQLERQIAKGKLHLAHNQIA